jgi:hypothetical protein
VDEQGFSSRLWRKSSYSGGGGECIEVGGKLPGLIAVRDSKNPNGPVLTFALAEWVTFMNQLKDS